MPAQQQRAEPPRDRGGALYAAGLGGRIAGNHPGYVMRRSLYTRGTLHPVATAAIVAGFGLAAASLLSHRHRT